MQSVVKTAHVVASMALLCAVSGCVGFVKDAPNTNHGASAAEGGTALADAGRHADRTSQSDGGSIDGGKGAGTTQPDMGAAAHTSAGRGGRPSAGSGDAAGKNEAGSIAAGSGGNHGLPDDGKPIGDATGTTAVRASDFLNTLGACVHVGQGRDEPSQSATALSFTGVRNIRDDGNPAAVQSLIAMHQSAGVRVVVLSNRGIATTVDIAKQLRAADALLAVEGPNEPNNFPVTYEGQTSKATTTFLPVAHFQRDLYAAVKAEPSLRDIPVFHSSEAGGSEPDNVGLQYLTIPSGLNLVMPSGTRYADYANTHNYIPGHKANLVDNIAWNTADPTLNGDWDSLYVEYGRTWNKGFSGYSNAELVKLPWVTTETGWVTSGTSALNEEQQGRLFLNLYLSAFKRGISYTFIYMLRDDPIQGYWGLFDPSYKPKKSGTYIHNLTTILADASARTPGKLNYSIASQPATVHDLLLQKSTGAFALVVWGERPSGGSDAITVNLGAPRASLKIYDPTTGTAPTQTLQNINSVPLTLSDHPVVLELQ